MDLSDLRCFVAVAEELHFGRAADRLVYTKSHVSQIVARLERELGLPLFTRSTRQVALTTAGSQLLNRARTVLGAVEDLRREAADLAGHARRHLRIAYAPATGALTTRVVAEVSALGPAVAIQIEPKPSSPHVLRAVLDGEVGLGIAQWTAPELEAIPLRTPAPVVYVPARHRLASRSSVTLADIDREPLILPQRDVNPELYDATVSFFARHGVEPQYRPRHITSPAQIFELVLSRQGLAFGSGGDPGTPGLLSIPFAGPPPPGQTVYILRRPGPTDKLTARVLRVARSHARG
jgi:DNA-binding transcriptional LysR family regulator